jgi:acetyl-CoA acetyltransferase
VTLGCVEPVGEQGAIIARVAVLTASYAQETAGVQINRYCASGLEACNVAAAKFMSGQSPLTVGGGVEKLTARPTPCKLRPQGLQAARRSGSEPGRPRDLHRRQCDTARIATSSTAMPRGK